MVNNLESQYREKFEDLKEVMHSQMQEFLAESILNNSYESPELKAQVEIYKPIVESIIKSLKDSGILNTKKEKEEIDPEIVGVITEQTEVINDQSKKIKELKMRIKLHEMISENLSGLNKDVIREAINKFQGEDDLSQDELLKQLTNYINTRKPNQKTVQFESIEHAIDEVDAILEGNSKENPANKFKPKKKINIPGLKKRIVTESTAIRLPDEEDNNELDPAREFLRDFGHIGN